MFPNKRDLKAYVRFDGSGRVVAGSLILRRKKPKVGKWVEIPAYECCNPTTVYPPCIQFTLSNRGGASIATINIIDCVGDEDTVGPIAEGQSITICAQFVFETANLLITPEGPCPPVSDMRLKTNIVHTGNFVSGLPEYTWDWNATAKSLGVDNYPTKGVLAQEAMKLYPEAVSFDKAIGYYRVDYTKIPNCKN